MICKNCNTDVKDGNKFCTGCGAPMEAAPVMDFSTQPEKPGKSKKGWVKWLIIAAVIIGGAFSVYAFTPAGSYIRSWLLSPEEQFRSIEIASLNEGKDAAASILNSMTEPFDEGSVDIELEVSDELFETLDEFGISEDVTEYIGDVRSVGMGIDFAVEEDRWGGSAEVLLEDVGIVSANAVVDTEDEMLYVSYPDIVDGAMALDISDAMNSVQAFPFESMEKLKLSEELVGGVAKTLEAGINAVDNVERERTTLKVNGVEQSCVEFRVKGDEKLLKKMLKAMIRSARGNKGLKKEIVDFSEVIEEISGESIGLTADMLDEALDQALEEFEDEELPELDFTYIMYADTDDKIIGRALEFDEGTIKCVSAQDGNDYAFEYVIEADGSEIGFVGEGKLKDEKFTGDVALEADGVRYFEASFKNFYSNQKEMKFSGTVSFGLSKALVENMYLDRSAEVIANNIEIEASFNSSKSDSKTDISLKFRDVKLGTLSVKVSRSSDCSLDIPSETYDEYELDEMFENADLSVIIDRLREAGLPTDIIGLLMEGME